MTGSGSHGSIQMFALTGIGEVVAGEPLGELIAERAQFRDGDIVCISQKVVSKAEGRVRRLADVEPSSEALQLAERLEKDPALTALVLQESKRVVRAERSVLITETRSGLICANAGIDSSNLAGEGEVLLLPENPDRSAREIRARLQELSGAALAVLICDSFGRPWRIGQSEVTIGCAGLDPLDDWRGRHDRRGRELAATAIAVGDQLAAAADLARDKAAGLPVVVVRGWGGSVGDGDGPGAASLIRPPGEDLFR